MNILHQEKDSMIYKFFNLQIQYPSKGDWASTCRNDLKHLDINLSMDEIQKMSLSQFKNLVRTKCNKGAYKYLVNKRGSKGNEINYSKIEMSEYLMPINPLTIDDKWTLFSIRNKMVKIESNFSQNNSSKCACMETENMKHIYICIYLNESEIEIEYEKVFSGTTNELCYILRRFEENLDIREKYPNIKKEWISGHEILSRDPLLSILLDHSNGQIYIYT